MSITYICLPNCVTCRKGKAWLSDHNLDFQYRHLEKEPLSAEEITGIAQKAGTTVRGLINPRSRRFKELGLNLDVTEDEALDLMIKHPKIMFRPLALMDDRVLLGFDEAKFAGFFGVS